MWSPTHVQVLVKKAKGLKIKGKDGTNDAFVIIALGKEKYQTSVKEKATETVEWCEQCELSIPQQGNTAEIVLNVVHRNFLGVDEFLGMVAMPLRDFDVYERPKTKWYQLKCKPGQNKNDYRGELEVRTAFTVKAVDTRDSDKLGSTAEISSKAKQGSLISLNKAVGNIGGSLMSLGQKEKKNIKKLAKSVSHKVEKVGNKARKSLSSQHRAEPMPEQNNATTTESPLPDKFDINSSSFGVGYEGRDQNRSGTGHRTSDQGMVSSNKTNPFLKKSLTRNQPNHDPGVNSDDEDDFEGELGEDDMFRFDALSHRSSGNSLNVSENMGVVSKTSTPLSGSLENLGGGELLRKNFGGANSTSSQSGSVTTPGVRRGLASGSQSPLVTNSRTLSSTLQRKNVKENDVAAVSTLDEWEQKLLGKKSAVPYLSPATATPSVKSETLSIQSSNHSSRSNTLERNRKETKSSVNAVIPSNLTTLPTIPQETPNGQKKKLIPIGSDFEEMSPSPEFPHSPVDQTAFDKNIESVLEEVEKANLNKNKKMNFKWKSGVSFRDKDLSSRGHHDQVSTESLHNHGKNSGHSRNLSDGSGSSQQGGVPTGTRVAPMGRETTPTPNAPQRIPREVWDRFEGKTREDLIETVVQAQSQLESQGKRQVELEDYLDSLLMKVMARNPDLLQKSLSMMPASKLTPSIKRGLVESWVRDTDGNCLE